MNETSIRLPRWLLPAAGALLVIAVRAWYACASHFYYEDAFITLRYARNLITGQGFVYNAGERVLGTTTPLFALLLAGLGALFGVGHLPLISVVVGIAGAGAAALLLFALCRKAGLPDAVPVLATCLLALSYDAIAASVSGMESLLVVALMLGALTAALVRRPFVTGVLLGLMLMARVDTLGWLLLVLLWCGYDARGVPKQTIVALAVTLFPWVAFATAYFGSPLPHTLSAKLTAYAPLPSLQGARGWWSALHPFSGVALSIAFDGLFVVGTIAAARQRSALLVPAAFAVGQLVSLVLAAPGHPAWYGVPMAFCFMLVAARGAVALAGAFPSKPPPSPAAVLRWGVVAGVVITGEWAAAAQTGSSLAFNRALMDDAFGLRRDLGEWLHAHTPAGARIMAEPIGFLGYYANRPIIDMVGLVSPAMTTFRRRFPAGNAWFAESLQALTPDVVVLRKFERPRNRMFLHGGPLLSAPAARWFDDHYRLQRTFEPSRPAPDPAEAWSFAVYRRTSAQ